MYEEKSHVGLEAKLCKVCGRQYETGALLLDRYLRKSLNHMNLTGVGGFCTRCQKLRDDGYIAIVSVNNGPEGDVLKQEDADRTGDVAHIRAEAWDKIFDKPAPPEGVAFCDQDVIKMLQSIQHPKDKE